MAEVHLLKEEMSEALSKPWRLPRNLALAALATLAGISIGILIHTFHRGLPYIGADLFVWTLATYNACQLGSDSENVLKHTTTRQSLKAVFIYKNLSLLALALPIDMILITIACALLGDWSKFWYSVLLGLTAVIIALGFGNIVSVAWVYKPVSLWQYRHDRLKVFEYLIFLAISYISASAAIILAGAMGELLLKIINVHSFYQVIIGVAIMLFWAFVWWTIALNKADSLIKNHKNYFVGRLNGEPLKIKNKRAKKILKLQGN